MEGIIEVNAKEVINEIINEFKKNGYEVESDECSINIKARGLLFALYLDYGDDFYSDVINNCCGFGDDGKMEVDEDDPYFRVYMACHYADETSLDYHDYYNVLPAERDPEAFVSELIKEINDCIIYKDDEEDEED